MSSVCSNAQGFTFFPGHSVYSQSIEETDVVNRASMASAISSISFRTSHRAIRYKSRHIAGMLWDAAKMIWAYQLHTSVSTFTLTGLAYQQQYTSDLISTTAIMCCTQQTWPTPYSLIPQILRLQYSGSHSTGRIISSRKPPTTNAEPNEKELINSAKEVFHWHYYAPAPNIWGIKR